MNGVDLLAIAKGYPYGVPRTAYLYRDGAALPLGRPDTAGRTGILAYGSNRAPEQLARKFAGWARGTEIPVVPARLHGFDVVYSSHFTGYGSIPAILQPARGTVVEISMMWLTDAQLARLHETEGSANYAFTRLDGIRVEIDGHGAVDHAHCYRGLRGAFAPDGVAVPLAAVAATGRTAPALHQQAVLERARDLLAPGQPLDRFVLDTIGNAALRAGRTEALAAHALPPAAIGEGAVAGDPSRMP